MTRNQNLWTRRPDGRWAKKRLSDQEAQTAWAALKAEHGADWMRRNVVAFPEPLKATFDDA